MRYHSGLRRPAKRFSYVKILAVSLIVTGISLAAGFADFLLGSKNNPPIYSHVSQSNSSEIEADSSCAVPGPSACNVPPNGNPSEISDMTSDGDTLLSLFSLSFCDANAVEQVANSLASVIEADLGKRFLPTDEIPPGKRFVIHIDGKGEFQKATIELDPSRVFHSQKERDTIRSWKEDVVLDYKTEMLCFKVHRDIVQSVLAAKESRELALKLAHVFRWDIDFQADIRKGDECKIVFERRYADDRPSGYGRILFAAYEGKRTGRRTACLFNGEYYDENGVELKKNYLRAPLNILRITSGYGYRIHPILGYWKMHTGVDYGAPTGTPVYAIANGTVTFQGCGDAYGLYICVRHENGRESRYSHLSRILVKEGQRVKQRQTIGLVGSTGRSTGPHLFFEIIVNGKRINPTKVRMVQNPKAVPAPLKTRFETVMNAQARFLRPAATNNDPRT
ncbi:MAG TPA: M23 family metallopeptidase [Desulfomonilaceae bacterium]|nr:M23 family metallopeptidase [Desulfomonilaceae bacterium]